jgi:peptide/nickel transport system substrate-binding protein
MYMNTRFKRLGFIFVLIILALSLVGCGAADNVPTDGDDVKPPEATEAPDVPDAPAEETLVIAIPHDPVEFHGLNTDSGYEQMMGELILLSLTERQPDGTVIPELAVEVPSLDNGGVVVTDDYYGLMDVTWKIRDDVYWEDGEQVTVDDVLFTWDVIAAEGWTEGLDYTDSIDRIDDFSFVVHYNSLWNGYPTQFGGENFFVFAEHYCDASESFYGWNCDTTPLANGPFILEEWIVGDHLTFVKNPNYFEEGKPAFDKVIVLIVPEPTVVKTMMLEGDVDLDMWPGDTIWDEYKATEGIELSAADDSRWVMRLIINQAAKGTTDSVETPHPFLSQVEVRKAIRMAIDVDTITEEVFFGNGKPVWTEFYREPFVCDIPRPAFDKAAAGDLLTQAGWTDDDGDGVRECHGCPNANEGDLMSFELAIYSSYGEELELAQQLIHESLEEIGFDVNLTTVEDSIMWGMSYDGGTETNGNFDIDMWDDGYSGNDPADWIYGFYDTEAQDEMMGWNVGRYSNSDLDDLYYNDIWYLDETNQEDRHDVFCQMAEILEEDLPQILLWTSFEGSAYSSRISGPDSSNHDYVTWNIADWVVNE